MQAALMAVLPAMENRLAASIKAHVQQAAHAPSVPGTSSTVRLTAALGSGDHSWVVNGTRYARDAWGIWNCWVSSSGSVSCCRARYGNGREYATPVHPARDFIPSSWPTALSLISR